MRRHEDAQAVREDCRDEGDQQTCCEPTRTAIYEVAHEREVNAQEGNDQEIDAGASRPENEMVRVTDESGPGFVDEIDAAHEPGEPRRRRKYPQKFVRAGTTVEEFQRKGDRYSRQARPNDIPS